MKAINVKGASDEQLQMLVNKANIEGYTKWCEPYLFTVNSIKKRNCEVIYLEDDNTIQHSYLPYAERYYKNELITIQEYIAMKKSDLKPGMVVEYANGERRLVVAVNGELILISELRFAELSYYTEDLTNIMDHNINIIKIYQPKKLHGLIHLLECKNCIWERPKETVLTMQEIADKFGIPVEQLKIKK